MHFCTSEPRKKDFMFLKFAIVFLQLNRSYEGNVLIKSSDFSSEGHYQCEVSAEAPSFQTISKERALQVYSKLRSSSLCYDNYSNKKGNCLVLNVFTKDGETI